MSQNVMFNAFAGYAQGRGGGLTATMLSLCPVVNVNVNVNLYSASSQKARLMCSMFRVLIKKTRLQCTMKTVNLHVRLTQIVLEQVPCCPDVCAVTTWTRQHGGGLSESITHATAEASYDRERSLAL